MFSLDMYHLRNSVATFALPVDDIRLRVSLPRIALTSLDESTPSGTYRHTV